MGSQKRSKIDKIDKIGITLYTCTYLITLVIQNILKKHKNNKQLYNKTIKI